jgi:hypothetical protein
MIDFNSLKNNRKSSLGKITEELTKSLQKNFKDSSTDNEWKPTIDKAGNGFAIIRFLPAPAGEDVPFIRIWDHGFQGPGGWYIEKSLTTIGKDDPVSEHNTTLWNSGIEANKEIVRKQKRRLSYYSNIYVVKDPSKPENEGKVFIYKYGKKIFDKLNEAIYPAFDEQGRAPDNPKYDPTNSFNPFDMWDGANFKLKIRNKDDYRNYDKSEFDTQGPLLNDDDELEKIWRSQYSLKEMLDEKNFKSYDELKKRLEKTLGSNVSSKTSVKEEEEAFPVPQKTQSQPSSNITTPPWDEDEDEDLSFFKKLGAAD